MIRPTFQAFETAKRALNVAQLGLDTVGHNISNAKTPGYTRQRVDQVSLSLNGYKSKFAIFGVNSTGLGVGVTGVSQIRDPYLDNRYRAEASTNGELGVKSDGLTDINNIFDEIMNDNGLHAKFGDLINALDSLMQQADDKNLAAVVRNTASQLVQMINKSASQLETTRASLKTELNTTVESDVNSILEQIASLNTRIKEDNIYGNPSNELNDERNLLIDKLSEYVDIKVTRTPVTLANGLTIEKLGIELKDTEPPVKLVDGGDFDKLEVSEDPATGNVSLSVVSSVSGLVIPGGADVNLSAGALKGYIDLINGEGPNAGAGTNSFRGIPYYLNSLDEFAQQLAAVFNKVNNISADEAANSGTPPLVSETSDKNLFVPLTPTLNSPVPSWISSFNTGTLQLSGGEFDMSFAVDTAVTPNLITATVNGKDYVGEYTANGQVKFLDESGAVAFTISTTAEALTSDKLTIDATVTAKNISISQNWIDDPLYMTATKFNPITGTTSELTLSGGSNPAWLKSVANGNDGVAVKDGSYTFKFDDPANPTTVSVEINGKTYQADYKAGSTLELKEVDAGGNYVQKEDENGDPVFDDDGNPVYNVGIIITTTDKDVGATDAENIATIKNQTGAAMDNIAKFKDALNEANSYSVSGFSGNFREYIVGLYTDMALDKELNDTLLDASTLVIYGYADSRDAVSAVSVDEEGINMMTYQNFYNAAARYMTTLDEALDKIINGMGLVGR